MNSGMMDVAQTEVSSANHQDKFRIPFCNNNQL